MTEIAVLDADIWITGGPLADLGRMRVLVSKVNGNVLAKGTMVNGKRVYP